MRSLCGCFPAPETMGAVKDIGIVPLQVSLHLDKPGMLLNTCLRFFLNTLKYPLEHYYKKLFQISTNHEAEIHFLVRFLKWFLISIPL